MAYALIHSEIGTNNKPIIFPPQITVPTLALNVRNLSQRNPRWKSAGIIQALSVTNVGEVKGAIQWAGFGRTEVRLEIPAYPYQVVFTPNTWVYTWDLELYEKDKPGVDGQAIANAPTPEQTDLLTSLGLTGLESSLTPESFALVTAILKATTEKGRYARTIAYLPTLIPVQVFGQRNDRSGATLFNGSDKTIYVGFDGNLSPSGAVEMLLPGGQWVLDGAYIGPTWMVASGDSTSVTVVEYANTPFS